MATETATKRPGRLPKDARTKAESKEVRPRSEEPVYLDLEVLKDREDPRYEVISDLVFNRRDAKEMENAAVAARKEIDLRLAEVVDKYEVDGIIVDEDTGIDRIVRGSSGKYDGKYIKKVLTPDQHAKAWIEGKPNQSSYMKDISNPDKIAEIRGE